MIVCVVQDHNNYKKILSKNDIQSSKQKVQKSLFQITPPVCINSLTVKYHHQ